MPGWSRSWRASAPAAADHADPGKGEELLKLSEALFAQDIELLRNNEKLGKIEKLKNDFIEKMSRELRTPLNSIIEAIIGVLTGENESLSEPAKTSLRQALDDGTAFLRTLQNILDLWRIKQRELPIEIQDMNFPEMIDEAIFSVQDAIGKKQLSVSQRLHQPFPKIRSDLAKLGQIVFLLLDNAVKFTPHGQIEIAAKVEDGQLTCSVKDTGIGICPDDQQFIFDEFYQVDDSASPALARRRARAHAGARPGHPAGRRGLGLERGGDRNPRQLPDSRAARRLIGLELPAGSSAG